MMAHVIAIIVGGTIGILTGVWLGNLKARAEVRQQIRESDDPAFRVAAMAWLAGARKRG